MLGGEAVASRRRVSTNGSSESEVEIPIITESTADLNPEPDMSEVIPPTCSECGRLLVWSGRGRKPSKCKRGEGCKETEPVIVGARGGPKNEIDRIRQGMTELYVTVGLGLSFVDQFDGFTVGQNASTLAESWCKLAEQDPKVRKALMRLLTGTSWSGVIAAHVMVAVPILQHHHVIPTMMEVTATQDTND